MKERCGSAKVSTRSKARKVGAGVGKGAGSLSDLRLNEGTPGPWESEAWTGGAG